jgi:hypothetical protein
VPDLRFLRNARAVGPIDRIGADAIFLEVDVVVEHYLTAGGDDRPV